MWACNAQLEYTEGIWSGSRGTPTFYLLESMVGTVRESVEQVVMDIVDPLRKASAVHISVERI